MNGFTQLLLKAGPTRLFAALGIAAVVAALLFTLLFRMGGEEKALLFAGVEMREASEITQRLEAADIPYEMRGDGGSIYVARSRVLDARMMLSAEGLPSRGSIGYEIFDEPDALGQGRTDARHVLHHALDRRCRALDGGEIVARDLDAQRALDAGLEMAVQVGQLVHMRAVAPGRVEVLLQADARFGQRAGLVGGQHVHRAQVFNRRQAFDDHFVARHSQRAARQRDRDDHRQQLGREADGKRHREHERVEQRPLLQRVDQQHEQHQRDRQPCQQQAETARAALERGAVFHTGPAAPLLHDLAYRKQILWL